MREIQNSVHVALAQEAIDRIRSAIAESPESYTRMEGVEVSKDYRYGGALPWVGHTEIYLKSVKFKWWFQVESPPKENGPDDSPYIHRLSEADLKSELAQYLTELFGREGIWAFSYPFNTGNGTPQKFVTFDFGDGQGMRKGRVTGTLNIVGETGYRLVRRF